MYFLVAKQLIIMSLIVIISFLFSKKYHYGNVESRYLSKLILFVISPALILNTFTISFDFEKLKYICLSVALSFFAMFMMSILSVIFFRSKSDINKSDKSFDQMAVIYSNASFIGIPLIQGVFGGQGVFLLMGYIIIFTLFQWTQGIYLITGKISIKQILLNPNVIAIFFGIILFILPFNLPDIFLQTISMIGNLNSAVAMIILGILFANFKMPSNINKAFIFRITKVLLLRLIVFPIIILFFLKLLSMYVLQAESYRMLLIIIFIVVACPVAITVTTFAVLYGKDESYGSLLVSISSVLCIVTLPMLVKIAETVL